MWSGRLPEPLDPDFERWQRSFTFDRRLLAHELAASRAHARALEKAGVISQQELASLLRGLDHIQRIASSALSLEDEEVEDVHHFVEKRLASLIGDLGLKLHSGRSRNEQIATDLRLYVREHIDQLTKSLANLAEVLVMRADEAKDCSMPAYTHLQPAEPVLVAHWLLAYSEMFLRDRERLVDCRKRVNLCPLGSGAVAGSTLPLDRKQMATELGFERATANSIDATSDRDFVLEYVNALSFIALHLSRWAEEMILFSTQEFGFLHLPPAYSTGSSALPQKKNPDLLELTRGKTGRVVGDAIALMVTLKSLPLAYHKDLQEMQEPLFDASETMLVLLPLVTAWMKAAAFDYARLQKAAESGFMNALAAATYLVEHGVPFRLAHQQVGRAVELCLQKGCQLQDLSLTELRQFNPGFDQDFYLRLSLNSVLAIHDLTGGTAPARVRQAIAEAKQRLAALREVVNAQV